MTATRRPSTGKMYGAASSRQSVKGTWLPSTTRAGSAAVEWVQDRLTDRDHKIIDAVNRVRILRGEQLERLFFSSLTTPRSRVVSRSTVLRRLVDWRVLVPLERRIGGAGRGSTASVFALDSVGQKLIAARQLAEAAEVRVRRPGTPTDRTLKHMLAVAELYVRLVELSRSAGFTVADYQAEPACWWPNGLSGFMKPDAYVRLELDSVIDHWWVEHDEATESLPTLRGKLQAYLEFVGRGQLGPEGVVPRVLVSCKTERRREVVAALVSRLPPPGGALFAIVHADRAARFLTEVLNE